MEAPGTSDVPTESTFPGFGFANMTAVEDNALDLLSESGQDPSCVLLSCSPF